MMLKATLLAPFYAALVTCSPVVAQGLICKDVTIPVQVTAQNKQLPHNLSLLNLTDPAAINSFFASLPTITSSGSYTIAARYCEPRTFDFSKPLQVLVHGATYTRDYWSGLSAPGTRAGQEKYSWIEFAAKEGYSTLSIDRLCNGLSSHPNGLFDCQLPVEAETIAKVISAARAGSIRGVSRQFSKIVYVGHSVGSQVGNALSIQHPDAADVLLLTGWSGLYHIGFTGPLVLAGYAPSKVVDISSPILDPFYLKSTSYEGIRTVFYYGDFLEQLYKFDFDRRQTVTLGEAITSLLGAQVSSDYRGPVFVLNGNEDAIFCPTSITGPAQGQPGNCQLANVHNEPPKLYPNARSFGSYFTESTGHCLNTHENAQESFKAAHDWLASLSL